MKVFLDAAVKQFGASAHNFSSRFLISMMMVPKFLVSRILPLMWDPSRKRDSCPDQNFGHKVTACDARDMGVNPDANTLFCAFLIPFPCCWSVTPVLS